MFLYVRLLVILGLEKNPKTNNGVVSTLWKDGLKRQQQLLLITVKPYLLKRNVFSWHPECNMLVYVFDSRLLSRPKINMLLLTKLLCCVVKFLTEWKGLKSYVCTLIMLVGRYTPSISCFLTVDCIFDPLFFLNL